MVDPTGTIGAPTMRPKSDLDLAYEGSEGFIERVARLGKERDEAQEALKALNLGKNIQATKNAAARQLAESQAKLDEATKLQQDTQKAVAELKAVTQQECDRMRNVAQQDATKTRQMAQSVKDDADEYAKSKKADADALLAKVKEQAKAQQAALKQAQEAAAEAAAASASANAAEARANRLEAEVKAKLDRLRGALAGV